MALARQPALPPRKQDFRPPYGFDGPRRGLPLAILARLGPRAKGERGTSLVLMFKPTAGLAKLLTAEVYRLLADLREHERITIVLEDQEIRQALKIADYMYVLERGRNKFDGPVAEFTDLEKGF